jgi:outer membrane protein OmpA-like peptidoglycan-associated protein
MRHALARAATLLLLALAAACAKQPGPGTLVVVLPEEGTIGGVDVKAGDTETLLNQPYASSSSNAVTGSSTATLDQAQVDAAFGAALAARPMMPRKFVLYFKTDSDELTDESLVAFEDVFKDLAARPHYEVTVIGHTDRVAEADYNVKLSYERALKVRDMLAQRGLPTDMITVFGRGENDLLVPTEDEVAEPLNRRVEVTVR